MLTADKTKAKSSKPKRSLEKSISSSTVEVADYRHKNEKRKNIPDAGLAIYNYKPQEPVKYNYDPHLDPQIIWTGKAERPSFEVETVSLHIHERVSTQAILKSAQRADQQRQLQLFAEPDLPLDKRIEFYQHEMDWANRLILGDSLLVMNSLLERELMAGSVRMIYMDPPYGIAYNSNFQPYISRRDVRDGRDDSLTREPEQVKAYRDTWTLGVHSYLTYLRDRLLLCKDLLSEEGSMFIQISDENLHRVRCLMDEVFGAENFVCQIAFLKTSGLEAVRLQGVCDYLLWYAKNIARMKYNQLYTPLEKHTIDEQYTSIELPDGTSRRLSHDEIIGEAAIPKGRRFMPRALDVMQGPWFEYVYDGDRFSPPRNRGWPTTSGGLDALAKANRLVVAGKRLRFKRFPEDFPFVRLNNVWTDTIVSGFAEQKIGVVQTSTKVVERCILMTTDPGDLVFDPTCGTGTTAYCAERWGRRWVTCDTSRVAIALARLRLMTARFDYFRLVNPESVKGDFQYEPASRITLKSIAKNEQARPEKLVNKPHIDRDKVRVSGPFTVEAIPPHAVEQAAGSSKVPESSLGLATDYVNQMIELLGKSGVLFPGGKTMALRNIRPISSAGYLHAEGELSRNGETLRVTVSFGPRHGPVTAKQVDESIRSAYRLGFDILMLAGLAFDPEAQATIQKNPIPKLEVHLINISPDVIVGEYSERPLLKATKSSQLFTAFGQPDIVVKRKKDDVVVRILGVDFYNPETGEVYSSNADAVPAWFIDEDYDGYTFLICQAFFPSEATAKNPWDKLENALRGLVDKEKMEAFRGTESLPFKAGKQKQIAVKVIDIRGNEVMVVKSLNGKGTT